MAVPGVTRREFLGFALLVQRDPVREFWKLLDAIERTIDPIRWEFRPVASMTAAHRTTGVAPQTILLDAVDFESHSSGVVQPALVGGRREYADLDYRWTVDEDLGNWPAMGSIPAKPKNVQYNHLASFTLPAGTHVFVLDVIDENLDVFTYNETVTITDQDTYYTTTGRTLYYNQTTGDNGNAGTVGSPKQTWDDAITELATDDTRILLAYGETFTTAVDGGNITGFRCMVGAYGTPGTPDSRGIYDNAPIIQKSTSGGTTIRINGSTSDRDLKLVGIDIQGSGGTSNGLNVFLPDPSREIMVHQCRLDTGLHKGIFTNGTSPHDDAEYHFRWFITSCHFENCTDYCIFAGFDKSVIQGTFTSCHTSGEHNIRIWQMRKLLIDHCESTDVLTTGGGKHCYKLHGGDQDVAVAKPICKFNLFTNNWTYGNNGVWPIGIGPQDSAHDERFEELLCESNFTDAADDAETQVGILYWGRYGTFRNNICDLTGGSSVGIIGIQVTQRGIEPAPLGCRAFNNTVYMGGAGASFEVGIQFDSAVTTSFARNNILFSPNGSSRWEVLYDPSGNNTGSNNVKTHSDPGFTDAANGDFSLGAGATTLIDQGFDLDGAGVIRDFADGYRVGLTFDLGAYEFNAGSHPGGGPAPAQPFVRRWSCIPGSVGHTRRPF